jgi:type II secretory ATPase GspE/PulE/Tfp pilus assembly ATPase PilB-like protein
VWGLLTSISLATVAWAEQDESSSTEDADSAVSAQAEQEEPVKARPTTTSAPAPRPRRVELPNMIRPVGFAVLCGWVLVCLYFASWGQLKSGVPPEQRPAVNLFLLATGPIGWVCFEIVKRNPKLKQNLDDLLGRIALRIPSRRGISEDEVSLELCTSDGSPISVGGGRHAPAKDTLEIAKRIINEALERRASDVLIDPRSGEIHQVRFRIDGILHEVASFPTAQGMAIVNCLKVASRLDISEKRRPQDGAFIAKLPDREIKFRSATAGTLYGEKIAVRVFDVQAGLKDVDNLGLNDAEAEAIMRVVRRSDGMLLIAGPTGSGKTTTIYAALGLLAGQGRNIVTIEDPIEYPLENASQTEVNPRAGITFANGLRSILRQDPDVILVGEIRDAETAEIALQASQTGHLVVSTVHSNDGPTALARLVDFGIEPFLISTGLTAVLSQRLVRVLCSHCRRSARVSAELRREAARRQIALGKVGVAVGCDYCEGTGYVGRTGIFEFLPLSQRMGHLLTEKPSLATIQALARKDKVITMRQRGMEKVLQGVTTVDEVLRVTT